MKNTPNVRVSVTVEADRKLIPAVRSLVREVFLSEGMDEGTAVQMELVTEEACLSVVDFALKGLPHATYRVSLERDSKGFVLAVEHQGAPPDWERIERGEESGIGMKIIRHYSQNVRFLNMGREGNRLEIVLELLKPSFENSSIEEEPAGAEQVAMAPLDTPLQIRPMGPADAPGLARLMYEAYKYSYREFVYFPEKVAELLESGLLVSTVAVTPDGDLAAHQGLMKEAPDSPIAEICMGVVAPRFRGRKLFEKMKEASFSHARSQGLIGLFGEAVTAHAYSQKANRAQGGRETGFLLGYALANVEFSGICNDSPDRLTVLLFYTRLNQEPERCVHAPGQHSAIIRRIYEEGALRRTFASGQTDPVESTAHSQVKLKAMSDMGLASLQVIRYGVDFDSFVGVRLQELCTERFECVYVDLPLSDPLTPSKCESLERRGFFFSGIMPETANGDMLRLQYLNNVSLDPSRIVAVSDFGRALLDYVVAGWKRAEAVKFRYSAS